SPTSSSTAVSGAGGMGGSPASSSTAVSGTGGMGGSGGADAAGTTASSSTGVGGSGGAASSSSTASSGVGGGGGCGPGSGTLCWAERFGNGNILPAALATDSSGNIFVTGHFGGVVNFGNGPLTSAGNEDMFLVKFNPGGQSIWSKRFGSAQREWGSSLAVDGNGDVVVTGLFDSSVNFGGGTLTAAGGYDIFLAKFDSSGAYIWAKIFGDSGLQRASGVAVDGAGNVFVEGTNWDTVNFGSGPLTSTGPNGALTLAKFDPGGAPLWSHIFQNTGNAYAPVCSGVAVDGQGSAVIAGAFYGSIDFGAGSLVSAGKLDAFVVKLDPGGNLTWVKRFGDGLYQEVSHAAVDPNGNIFLTGNFNGSLNFGSGSMVSVGLGDIFLAKLDPSGNGLWSKRFGDITSKNAGFSGQVVTADAAGNAIMSGSLYGNADFGGGFLEGAQSSQGGFPYVAKFDGAGTYAWAYTGNTEHVGAQAVGTDPGGEVILSGSLGNPVSFAGANLTPTGFSDIYVLKLTP
ncbi:MAG: hypothetical protein ABI193_10885, partial [Minicystis sp.]